MSLYTDHDYCDAMERLTMLQCKYECLRGHALCAAGLLELNQASEAARQIAHFIRSMPSAWDIKPGLATITLPLPPAAPSPAPDTGGGNA